MGPCERHNECSSCPLPELGSSEDASIVYDRLHCIDGKVRKGGECEGDARAYRGAIRMVFVHRDYCTEVGGRRVGCMVSGTRDSGWRRDPCPG